MDVSTGFMILVPVVVGVIEACKMAGLPSRWAPILSILLGIGGAGFLGGDLQDIVIQGMVVGLSASGLYSATRATLKV